MRSRLLRGVGAAAAVAGDKCAWVGENLLTARAPERVDPRRTLASGPP